MLCCAGSPAPKETAYLDPALPRFTVAIEREPGKALGLSFDATREKDRVQVTQVIVGGPLADFNAQSAGVKVQPGDWIEQVNGAKDAAGMAQVLQSESSLTIKLAKSWAKLTKDQKKKRVDDAKAKEKGEEAKAATPVKSAAAAKSSPVKSTPASSPSPVKSTPAATPTPTNGQAPKQKEEKAAPAPAPAPAPQVQEVKEEKKEEEAEAKYEGPKLTADINGSWVSDGIEGDPDQIFKDLGVPWIARKAMKAAGWGKGMTQLKIGTSDDAITVTSIAPTTEVNTVQFNGGDQPWVDGKGKASKARPEIVEDGKVMQITFVDAASGKPELQIRYVKHADGTLRMPIKDLSPGAKALPTTILKKM